MAKFCDKCGRPLNEGEVCTCTQNEQQAVQQDSNQGGPTIQSSVLKKEQTQNDSGNGNQMQNNRNENQSQNTFSEGQASFQGGQSNANNGQAFSNNNVNEIVADLKTIFSKIVPIFKSPVEEIKKIAATGTTGFGWEMVTLNVLVTFVMAIIAMFTWKHNLGAYADYMDIPYVRIVLSVTIMVAVNYVVLAGLLYFASNTLFKSNIAFSQIISIIGSKAVIDGCFLVVGVMIMMISIGLGMVIVLLGNIYSILVMIVSYIEMTALDGSKKVYSLLITYVGLFIIYYLIYRSLLNDILSVF